MFFVYGLTNGNQVICAAVSSKEKESGSPRLKLTLEEAKRTTSTPYRPPHLRKKDSLNTRQAKALDPQSSSDHISSMVDVTSSDSDYSDSDGSLKDINDSRCSKIRVSAIVCIQVSLEHHSFLLVITFDFISPMFICSYKAFFEVIFELSILNVEIFLNVAFFDLGISGNTHEQ